MMEISPAIFPDFIYSCQAISIPILPYFQQSLFRSQYQVSGSIAVNAGNCAVLLLQCGVPGNRAQTSKHILTIIRNMCKRIGQRLYLIAGFVNITGK